jgi:hypothetical protein
MPSPLLPAPVSWLGPELGTAYTDVDSEDSWWRLLQPPPPPPPLPPPPPPPPPPDILIRWRALSCLLIITSVVGHHLLCRVRLRNVRRRPGGTPLQVQLIEAAALQLQAAAIPVGAHALGLAPRGAAAACTPMLLFTSPLGAALYCVGFLAVNLMAAGLLVRRWRSRGDRDNAPLVGRRGGDTPPERLWTDR